jgi:hypothetical protein
MNRRVRSNVGLGVRDLSEEAAVFIAIYYVQEGFKTADFQVWLVPMPFKVTTHPEYAPTILGPNEGCLRDRVLYRFFPILPVWTNFEDLYTLARGPISKVQFKPNVRWRATTLHEFFEIALTALHLKIGQRHRSPRPIDAQRPS